MFKRVTIEMSGPICSCEDDGTHPGNCILTWTPTPTAGLTLRCSVCGATLHVPHEKFRAAFKFDTPYPKKAKAPEPKPAPVSVSPLVDPSAAE